MSHPGKSVYEQDNGQTSTGAMSLLNAIGNSKTLAGGFAGFMVKSIVVASSASVVFGLASSMIFFGPYASFAFLGGASFGFIGGLVHRWRTDTRDAAMAAEQFPELIKFHIRNLEPHAFEHISFEDWRKSLAYNIQRQGSSITAYYNAFDAIAEVRRRREAHIVERLCEAQDN